MKTSALFLTFLLAAISPGKNIEERDFGRIFDGHDGTIVVYDKSADKYIVHNKKRSGVRYTPFSTFKIPNSIIALETGILADVEVVFPWDTTKYQSEAWWPAQWRDKHTMRTAIRYSVVPFYRNIASNIGEKKMKEYVTAFKYGNGDISSGVDNFWLNGSLSVSAMEQIEFLQKFYNNDLGVSERTIMLVKNILIQEETENYRISAKTGGGNVVDKDNREMALGWYVGYIEKGKDVFFFAHNIDGKDFAEIKDLRINITESVLKELKIVEKKSKN